MVRSVYQGARKCWKPRTRFQKTKHLVRHKFFSFRHKLFEVNAMIRTGVVHIKTI